TDQLENWRQRLNETFNKLLPTEIYKVYSPVYILSDLQPSDAETWISQMTPLQREGAFFLNECLNDAAENLALRVGQVRTFGRAFYASLRGRDEEFDRIDVQWGGRYEFKITATRNHSVQGELTFLKSDATGR